MSESNPRSLREELEVRVIALLTGEISEADADELEKILAADEELSAYRDRMAILMGDMHAARDEIVPDHPAMRLSDESRRLILTHGSQQEEKKEVAERSYLSWNPRWIEWAAVAAVLVLIAGLSFPGLGLMIQRSAKLEMEEAEYLEAPSEPVAISVPKKSYKVPSRLIVSSKLEGLTEETKDVNEPVVLAAPPKPTLEPVPVTKPVPSDMSDLLVSESVFELGLGASGLFEDDEEKEKPEEAGAYAYGGRAMAGENMASVDSFAPSGSVGMKVPSPRTRPVLPLEAQVQESTEGRKWRADKSETLEGYYASQDESIDSDKLNGFLPQRGELYKLLERETLDKESFKRLSSSGKKNEEDLKRKRQVAQVPKAEKVTSQFPSSTFSLNVSDVSFEMAQAALNASRIPDAASIRSEEFINSFEYGDPAPRAEEAVALHWEMAQHPYAHGRQVLRFSLQAQAEGRGANQPLNINLLVDNSGSMQRPDRRAILEKGLQSLGEKLTDEDQLNIILFARQPKLIANASNQLEQQQAIADTLAYRPEGGTNLEAALSAAYGNAQAHYNPRANNRVILMTDGAANLGDVDASALATQVVEQRKQGIALDAYGIGWEGYNDALLEEITRNGDGRYAFLNSVDSASADFSEKLAGALRAVAADVKVQVNWNPEQVRSYRQLGYDLHQLTEEQFRDNTVDAAEISEAEAGTALYVIQPNESGEEGGLLGTLHIRYREVATGEYREHSWPLVMPAKVPALERASPALRLAASSAFFAERLANNPYAGDYSLSELYALTAGLPAAFPEQERVVELQNMINSARMLLGAGK